MKADMAIFGKNERSFGGVLEPNPQAKKCRGV